MAQQHDASPSLQSVAELGAVAVQAAIAFWWRWPALVVAAQIVALRILAASINREAPAGAPAREAPAPRNTKTKSKRRRKG
jgi:hypothetical protein